MRQKLCNIGMSGVYKMRGFTLLETWVRTVVSEQPTCDIFIDELAFTSQNMNAAFSCISKIISVCNEYIWVVCKREGNFYADDNTTYTRLISELVDSHGVLIPQLSTNLRSNGEITKVVQQVAADRVGQSKHPTPAAACSSIHGQPPFFIHAPDARNDVERLRKAIERALSWMKINPLTGTECVVVIVNIDKVYSHICNILSGPRVVRYYPRSDDNIDSSLYGRCSDISNSLLSVMKYGGILITSSDMFSGAEATHVICIDDGRVYSYRDAALRSVSQLVYIYTDFVVLTYNSYITAGAVDGGVIQ